MTEKRLRINLIFKLREVFLFVPFRETIFGGKSRMDFHLNKVLQRGKETRGISFVLDAQCTLHRIEILEMGKSCVGDLFYIYICACNFKSFQNLDLPHVSLRGLYLVQCLQSMTRQICFPAKSIPLQNDTDFTQICFKFRNIQQISQ